MPSMGRSLSPLLRQELENLDKDADSRRSAMKALKSYAKHLDSKAIPHFLAEVSDPKGSGAPSGEFTISLYEVLARVHGRNIVPQIDNIMSTIMCTLSSSGGSFPLHQACSKVVPAIARYGIDPSTPDDEKARIIGSLCKPLCDALMGPQESVAAGAALCLKALVESNNWRFASSETVNEVCLKAAGALLEAATQSNAHMGLAMALVKHNGLVAEAYARSLVRSGLQILADGGAQTNSQKRFSAIQMINFLMKFVDPRCISSELTKVAETMERCQNDRMPFVRGAAFEASQTAKSVAVQKGSRHEMGSSPLIKIKHNAGFGANGSPCGFPSPESQIVDSSIMRDDAFIDSPISVGQASSNREHNRHTNRRLWNNENRGVDVSLKDGFFLQACSGSKFSEDEFNADHSESFSGFALAGTGTVAARRDTTPSTQRSRRQVALDDIKIYTTPRKLIRSLQNSSCADSREHEKQPTVPQLASTGFILQRNIEKDVEPVADGNESVSSTSEVPESHACKPTLEAEQHEVKVDSATRSTGKNRCNKAVLSLVWSLFLVLLATVFRCLSVEDEVSLFGLVPT